MAIEIRPSRDAAEFRSALGSIGHYFGGWPDEAAAERFGTRDALRAGDDRWSFVGLDRLANGFAARLLDAGVWNLHIPQVDTPEQAAEVVACSRYAPLGSRGMYGFGPHTQYRTLPPAEHMAAANARVHVTAMLETKRAFDHLDGIASVPGIDALTIGPTDLAQDLGVLGTPKQREVLNDYRRRLVEACRKRGKAVSMAVDSVETVREMIAMGATIVNFSSETAVLRAGYATAVAEIRR